MTSRFGVLTAAAIAGLASFGVADKAHAVAVDLLPLNSDLAIYFQEFPATVETAVDLTSSSGSTSATGTAGAVPVNFLANVNVDAANGAATIKPSVNGGVISSLTITTPGFTFGDIQFGAQLNSTGTGNNYQVDFKLEAFNGGTSLGTFTFGHPPADQNANQLYMIVATGALDITSVVLSSTIGVNQFKQFFLSEICSGTCPPGGPGPAVATPLPAAAWLFGTVLAGGVGIGRWRRKRKAALAA
jgi:hypothetical protein